jgi:hypothetical protein
MEQGISTTWQSWEEVYLSLRKWQHGVKVSTSIIFNNLFLWEQRASSKFID